MTSDAQPPAAAALPGRVEGYGLLVRRWEDRDAPALHAAITANVDHLRPHMPWIAHEPQTLRWRRDLVQRWTEEWAAGGDLTVGIWRDGRVLGSAGLYRRLGPGGLEIGYWVDREHLGQGVATAASRALTDLAFTVPDVEVVQICHDVGNVASGRVPAKLGFRRLDDRAAVNAPAPASTGAEAVWQVTREEWRATRTSATAGPSVAAREGLV